jgi:hypothetical protein
MRAATSILILLCLASLAAAACAPRARLDPRPGMALTADLARADALVAEGCYACLKEALAAYEQAAATGRAPAAGARAIDAALLLAFRERELGLGSGRALEHAVESAGQQPPPFDAGLFLSVLGAQPWHAYGVTK